MLKSFLLKQDWEEISGNDTDVWYMLSYFYTKKESQISYLSFHKRYEEKYTNNG